MNDETMETSRMGTEHQVRNFRLSERADSKMVRSEIPVFSARDRQSSYSGEAVTARPFQEPNFTRTCP